MGTFSAVVEIESFMFYLDQSESCRCMQRPNCLKIFNVFVYSFMFTNLEYKLIIINGHVSYIQTL